MKKSIWSVIIVFALISLYCIFEIVYINRIHSKITLLVDDFQQTESDEKMKEQYKLLKNEIEDDILLMRLLLSKREIEEIEVTLHRLQYHLEEGQIKEAKAEAENIRLEFFVHATI